MIKNRSQLQDAGAAAMRSPPGRWRLLAPALLCWAITAWAVTSPGASFVVALAAGSIGGALMLCGLFVMKWSLAQNARQLFALLAIACAALVIIGARVTEIEHARTDPQLLSAAEEGASTEFTAHLAGYPEHRETQSGARSWVHATVLGGHGGVSVLLWLDAETVDMQNWAPGRIVIGRGRFQLQAPEDRSAFTVSVYQIATVEPGSAAGAIGAVAAQLRRALVVQAASVDGAELVPGFAVGDTSLVSSSLEHAMLESSLLHLVAVSGSNTGLVIAAVTWLCSRLGAGRRPRILIAAGALGGFVIVVGPDASVQRAAVMAAVLLASSFGGRRASSMPALGVAVLLLLIVDPWQALQPGFALSVAATAGILLLAAPLSEWLQQRVHLPRLFALPFAVALAAQLACGPFLLLLQPGIPVVGVLANVIAAPAAPVGTGLGLLAALMAPISSELAHLVVLGASLPARWIAATAQVTAELPLGRWSWPADWGGAALLAFCQFALFLAWAVHRGKIALPGLGSTPPRLPWQATELSPLKLRIFLAALSSASLGCIVAVTFVAPLGEMLRTPRGWAVVACDVGQGDALLLRDPRLPERVMLVDTGDDPELLEACLARFGVQQIALLVLSHDDLDHVGALESVIDRVDGALIAPTPADEAQEERMVVRLLELSNVPYIIGAAGIESVAATGGVSWQVFSPAPGEIPKNSNAGSLVMRVTAGTTSVLLLGDTGAEQQARLLRSGALPRVQVVKVAHHGSRDQDHSLPHAVGARWALVSVGAENRYGHPAAETLAASAQAGARTLRTDLHGSIALIPNDDGTLGLWVERAA